MTYPSLPVFRHLALPLVVGLSTLISACGGGGNSDAPLSAEASLGARAFADASLSASGEQSCASCHVEVVGFAQNNALAAQFGGPLGNLQGGRSSPSAAYLHTNGAFNVDADGVPNGGFFWDGRVDSLAEQAGHPFLGEREMAMPSKAAVIDKVKVSSYAADFKAQYGATIFDNVDLAYLRLTEAIAKFETEAVAFRAFTSKYDAFLRNPATNPLSAQESRGLALFNDPAKGNCAACHPSEKAANGDHPLFTDFSYDALGVPRNPLLLANADPAHFDLGLCESSQKVKDTITTAGLTLTDLCGAFKVPSLRNVAKRKTFFHNSAFTSLTDVVTFYVQRDTNPEKWYPTLPGGGYDKFNDLPQPYRANVNVSEAPYNKGPGDAPALSDTEIADVVAFLKTLSDGYTAR